MYELNQYLQDCILKLMIEDIEFLKMVRLVVDPVIFTLELRKQLCEQIYIFYDGFKSSPGYEAILTQIENNGIIKRKGISEYIDSYFDKLEETLVNKEFVLKELNTFIRRMRLINVLERSEELIKKNDLGKIEEDLINVFKINVGNINLGKDYFSFDPGIYAPRQDGEGGLFFGIPKIDQIVFSNRGMSRKRFACIMGDYKGKKSWGLVQIAVQALKEGFSVLYVSLELDEREIE